MKYIEHNLGFDEVVNHMEYLGYPVRRESGGLTEATMRTASALKGKPMSPMLASQIAEEYAKHNPRFMKGEPPK